MSSKDANLHVRISADLKERAKRAVETSERYSSLTEFTTHALLDKLDEVMADE